jgi:beta-glucanase (GH16 family)
MPDGDCYQANNVAVGGGYLKLTAKKLSSAMNCSSLGQTVKTKLTAGAVTNLSKFKHTYGRVEFRAAYPAAPSNMYAHSALWMMPDGQPYGAWPYSGEIDVSERMPFFNEPVYSSLHYADKSGATNYSNGDKNPGESYLCQPTGNATDFHTYSVEWNPTDVTFLVDNVECKVATWDPANAAAPAPFNVPFHEILTQAIADDGSAPVGTYTMKVDWVKVWTK